MCRKGIFLLALPSVASFFRWSEYDNLLCLYFFGELHFLVQGSDVLAQLSSKFSVLTSVKFCSLHLKHERSVADQGFVFVKLRGAGGGATKSKLEINCSGKKHLWGLYALDPRETLYFWHISSPDLIFTLFCLSFVAFVHSFGHIVARDLQLQSFLVSLETPFV